MNVVTIVDCAGVTAGLAAITFFLAGRQRRPGGANMKLLPLLLLSVFVNASVDAAEHFALFEQLDFVEDYIDLVLLLGWAIFLVSLFPRFAGKLSADRGLHGVFTRQLTGVFLILLVLNFVYSLTSFINSRDTLAKMRDYHGPALVSVVGLQSRSNDAIQEAFSYVVSGVMTEKQEFEALDQSFQEEAGRFRILARLNQPDEKDDLATFRDVMAAQRMLSDKARQMFAEFESTGQVSSETFADYESAIDVLGGHLAALEHSVRVSHDQTESDAAKMLEATSFELPMLGVVALVLCSSLFGLLVWSFRQYSDEQEMARQELANREKQHRAFLDNLPELIWVAGTDRLCSFFNKTWLDFTGRTLEQEQGYGWTESIHPDDFDQRLKTYQSAFDAREPFTMEYRLRHSDGQYRWILDIGTPWLEADDRFAGYIGGCIDITDRRNASVTLRQRNQAFRMAITPLAFADLEGRITEANQAFADLFGVENVDQVIGKLNTDFDSEPISVAQINSLILETGGFDGEVTSRRLDGSAIDLQISATLFTDDDDRPIGQMAAFMDVTSRRQMERALRNSEQHYRTLTESAPEAIVVLDVDQQRFVEVNESAIEMFHMPRHQLLRTNPADLSPERQPDGRESAKAAMEYVQRALDGEVPNFDWVHLDSEGNEIICDVHLAKFASDRRLVRGSLTDIRERIELENTLSRRALEAELLHQAVTIAGETDSLDDALQKCVDIVCKMIDWPVGHAYVPSSDGTGRLEPTKIWHFDDDREFASFRDVTERTSFAMGEGLPGGIWKSKQPAWIENVQKDVNFKRSVLCEDLGVRGCFGFPVMVRGETVAILEFFNRGEVARNETLLLLVRSVGEQVGRVIERKEAHEATRRRHELVAEELDKAKAELILRTRLAAIGQMSAQIAHEMRNPLGAVSNAVYYLKRQIPSSELKWAEYLSLIDGEVATCNRFISDLLDVTRGKAPNLATTNFVDLVDRVVARHEIPANVEVNIDCRPNPFEILADSGQIVQVIDNLLKNALDALGEKGGRIDVRARRDGESAIITMHDSGGGISTENRGSVFDVLVTFKPTGTGLGLPICKQIVERHGGVMALIDDSLSGTTFEVRLPLTRDQPVLS